MDDGWTVVARPTKPSTERRLNVSGPNNRSEIWEAEEEVTIIRRGPLPVKMTRDTVRPAHTGDVARHQAKIGNATETFKHPVVKTELVKKMCDYRRKHQLSQRQLGAEMGLQESVIRDYEARKVVPHPAIVQQINNYLARPRG